MELNNKTLLIAGLIVIGVITTILGNNNLSYVVVGVLGGYLSKDGIEFIKKPSNIDSYKIDSYKKEFVNALQGLDEIEDEVDSCNQKTDTLW